MNHLSNKGLGLSYSFVLKNEAGPAVESNSKMPGSQDTDFPERSGNGTQGQHFGGQGMHFRKECSVVLEMARATLMFQCLCIM